MRKPTLAGITAISLSLALAMPNHAIQDGSLQAHLTDTSHQDRWELAIEWKWQEPDASHIHGGELLLCTTPQQPNNECTLIREFGPSTVQGSNTYTMTSTNWLYPEQGQVIRAATISGPWTNLQWTGEQEEAPIPPPPPPLPPPEYYGPRQWFPIVEK